jgi:hypothetical protein
MAKPRIDLTGRLFGRLTVKSRIVPPKGRTLFVCACECGKEVTLNGSDLQTGNTTSCGCLRDDKIAKVNYKHGAASCNDLTGAYRSWRTMKDRCYNEDNNRFYAYGARGIQVCDRWRDSFENFFADMGERPDGYTLDRIDVNADYSPENCRWASVLEQARNQRTNVWYQVGDERMIQADVARALGIHPSQVLGMRRRGNLPSHIQAITA